jgi:hypothetical protein
MVAAQVVMESGSGPPGGNAECVASRAKVPTPMPAALHAADLNLFHGGWDGNYVWWPRAHMQGLESKR